MTSTLTSERRKIFQLHLPPQFRALPGTGNILGKLVMFYLEVAEVTTCLLLVMKLILVFGIKMISWMSFIADGAIGKVDLYGFGLGNWESYGERAERVLGEANIPDAKTQHRDHQASSWPSGCHQGFVHFFHNLLTWWSTHFLPWSMNFHALRG